MTLTSFCDLVMEEFHNRQYRDLKMAAKDIHISPACMGYIYQRIFPNLGGKNHARSVKGRIFSLTRVCDRFDLDLLTCLEACGLPHDEVIIRRSREQLGEQLDLTFADMRMLFLMTEHFGPLPYQKIPELVKQFRSNHFVRLKKTDI